MSPGVVKSWVPEFGNGDPEIALYVPFEGTRELVVPDTPYRVPYRVRGHAVEILHVFHGARKWKKKL